MTARNQATSCGYAFFDTAIGVCGAAWSEEGLTRLQLPEATRVLRSRNPDARAQPPPETVRRVIEEICGYLEGRPTDFRPVVLDLGGIGEFHRLIYGALREVKWGETVTYGTLAERVGAAGAARAVGHAMGRNPVPIIIPCHRVLASGNRVGGFSAYGGTVTKERLLELEGVYLDGGAPLLPGLLSERR